MQFNEDPKFSVIVPVHNVPAEVFKRCLLSIADQDYQDLEVIIVPNGGDENSEKLALEFAKDKPNWKVEPIKEKGACQARNYGFKKSTGEIVAFVNSDYILKVGCISMWVEELLAHPDCGFVYGAYEYATAERELYPSKSFDVYHLEVANYIDCGFPLWRKHVVEWDENVKSLQDWDFWLRVVKNGVKGHFLGREISFIAEPPRAKGLSEDSGKNWIERVKFVKEKNDIPMRDICVTSIGAPFHGNEIAKMINADYRDDTIHKPHEYKALYLIGWYMKPGEQYNGHSRILSYFQNSKKIVHFVGADIYWLRKFSSQHIREFAGALQMATDHILCENELAQNELAEYGIKSDVVPIPPYTDLSIEPLPKEFSVALYLTDRSDFDKYLKLHTLSIVKAMPDVKFYGYGDADLGEFKADNLEHRGNMKKPEWENFVKNCSAYLRIVRHDTTPMASAEFMMAGRAVISNIPNECTHYINSQGTQLFDKWDKFGPGFNPLRWPDTKKEIIQTIRKVRDYPTSDELRIEISESTKKRFDKKKYLDVINKYALTKSLEVINQK